MQNVYVLIEQSALVNGVSRPSGPRPETMQYLVFIAHLAPKGQVTTWTQSQPVTEPTDAVSKRKEAAETELHQAVDAVVKNPERDPDPQRRGSAHTIMLLITMLQSAFRYAARQHAEACLAASYSQHAELAISRIKSRETGNYMSFAVQLVLLHKKPDTIPEHSSALQAQLKAPKEGIPLSPAIALPHPASTTLHPHLSSSPWYSEGSRSPFAPAAAVALVRLSSAIESMVHQGMLGSRARKVAEAEGAPIPSAVPRQAVVQLLQVRIHCLVVDDRVYHRLTSCRCLLPQLFTLDRRQESYWSGFERI
jgi:hypothetical protein